MSDVSQDGRGDRDDRDYGDDELVEFEVPTEFGPLPPPVTAESSEGEQQEDDETGANLEVRRRAGLAALVGVVAGAVATAYLARAVDTGAPGDWAVCALMGVVSVGYLAALVDARAPLLVADEQGVRLRMGRSWLGLTWGSLRRVEVVDRRGLHDGRLVLVPRNDERVLEQAGAGARRAARLSGILHGTPFAVPLTLANRVDVPAGLGTGLVAPLRTLADGRTDIVIGPVLEPADEPGLLESDTVAMPAPDVPTVVPEVGFSIVPSATPSPLREPVAGRRSEVRRELPAQGREQTVGANALKADLDGGDSSDRVLPEDFELRRPGSVELEVEAWSSYGEEVRPVVVTGDLLETIVVDDFAIEAADEPVIGPAFAAARSRLGLTIDQLAERTRIRPHVIESIEVDDFVPCGGDFYARGHIRTLARVLGVDAAVLLESYDERYADAPVNARRIFEAELAHSGGIRATRGGPNWSVLVAAVMALVLAWSIARLVMDGPVDLRDEPVLNGSGGPNGGQGVAPAPKVPVVISAPASGARVIVRDGQNEVVFTGDIAFGDSKTFSVSPPVRVQATDGSVTVSLDGDDRGPLGKAGSPGSGTYVVR